jgi:chromosome segregation ATPase
MTAAERKRRQRAGLAAKRAERPVPKQDVPKPAPETTEIAELEAHLELAHERIAEHLQHIENAHKRIAERDKYIAEANQKFAATLDVLREKFAAAEANLNALDGELAQATVRIAELEQERDHYKQSGMPSKPATAIRARRKPGRQLGDGA